MKILHAALTVLACAAISETAIAQITVGTFDTGNCYPFMCNDSGTSVGQSIEYQQVYSSAAFSMPVAITSETFYWQGAQIFGGSDTLLGGSYLFSLSTTAAPVNGLSSTLASNLGPDNAPVLLFSVPAGGQSFGTSFTFHNAVPFFYNPGLGNLLMDVNVSGASAPGGNIFFDTNGFNGGADNGNTIVGRVYCPFGDCSMHSPVAESGYGLVTDFSTGTAVPEPSFVYVLGGALALLGVAQRVRRNRRADG